MFDCGTGCVPLWQTTCEGLRMQCSDGGVCCAFGGGRCDGPCLSIGDIQLGEQEPELPRWRPRPKRRARPKPDVPPRAPSPEPTTSEPEKPPGVGGVCEWPFGCPYCCAEPEPEKPKTPEDDSHGWGTLLEKEPPELEPYNPPVPCGIGYPCGYRTRGKLYMPGGPGQVFPRMPCRPMPVCTPCQPSPCMPCMPCIPCPPCPIPCEGAGRRTRYTSLMAPAVPMSVSAIVALSLLAANHASGTCKCPMMDPCQPIPCPPSFSPPCPGMSSPACSGMSSPPCPGVGPTCSLGPGAGFCPTGPIINSGNAFNAGPCTQNCMPGGAAEQSGPGCLRPALSERRLAGGAENVDKNAGQPRISVLPPASPEGEQRTDSGGKAGAEAGSGNGTKPETETEVKKVAPIPGTYPYMLDPPPGLYPQWLGCGPYAYNCFSNQPPVPTCVPGIMPPSGKLPPCFFPPPPGRCASAVSISDSRETTQQSTPDKNDPTKKPSINNARYPNGSINSINSGNKPNNKRPKPINFNGPNNLNANKSNNNYCDPGRTSRTSYQSGDPSNTNGTGHRQGNGGLGNGRGSRHSRGSRKHGAPQGGNSYSGSLTFGGADPRNLDMSLPPAPLRFPPKLPCGCTRIRGPCPPECLQPKPVGSEEEERRRRERHRRRLAALHPKCTLPLVLPYQRKRGARKSVIYPPKKPPKGFEKDKEAKGHHKHSDENIVCPREKQNEVCVEPEPSPSPEPSPVPAPSPQDDWCIPYITPFHFQPGSRSLSAPPDTGNIKWGTQGACFPGMECTPGAASMLGTQDIRGIQGMPQIPSIPCAPGLPKSNICYANMLQTMPLGPMGAMGPVGPMGSIPISPPGKARSGMGPPVRMPSGFIPTGKAPSGSIPPGMIPAGIRPSAAGMRPSSILAPPGGGGGSVVQRPSAPRFVDADDRSRRRERKERHERPGREERSERHRSQSRRHHSAQPDPCTGVCAPCPVQPDGCGPAAMRAAGYTNIPLDRGPCFPGPPPPTPPLPCGQRPTGPAYKPAVCTKDLETGKEAPCVEKKTLLCKITPVTKTLMCYERNQPICAEDPTICGGSESCMHREQEEVPLQPEYTRRQLWPPPPPPPCPGTLLANILCLPPPPDGEPQRMPRPRDRGCGGPRFRDDCATFSSCATNPNDFNS